MSPARPTWVPERNVSARQKWCDGPFCPANLIVLLSSKAVGKTVVLRKKGLVTLTVIGGGTERSFASKVLIPVLLECVRVLSLATHSSIPVHVTYCNACGDRLLPTGPGTIVSSEHVNGGISMGVTNGVLVFRRQDSEKVLVHELLHLYGIDAPLRNLAPSLEAHTIRPCPYTGTRTRTQTQTQTRSAWGARRGSISIGLNEAYTDALACIVFCGDISRARSHALIVAARILAHFDVGLKPFLESTHAFAYYVVKAAILVNGEAFVSFLKQQRDGLTPDHPLKAVRFMEQSLRSTAFISAVMGEIRRQAHTSNEERRGLHMTDGRPGLTSFSKVGVLI